MEIIVIALILVSIMLLKFIFKIDLKKVEPLKENKQLEEFTNKFPKNIDIAKEMLDILGNNKVKVKEVENTNTNLYIAATDTISIANMKNNYARIQVIAHECMHSIQDRRLLLFNFIFSNINIIYFIVAVILTITKVINNYMLQIFVLMLFAIIKLAVRGYLETDAIIKSKYLAEKYMQNKKIITNQEIETIIEKYDEINKISVPLTIVQLLTNSFICIFIYALITFVV